MVRWYVGYFRKGCIWNGEFRASAGEKLNGEIRRSFIDMEKVRKGSRRKNLPDNRIQCNEHLPCLRPTKLRSE
jgi:hypothetical protein